VSGHFTDRELAIAIVRTPEGERGDGMVALVEVGQKSRLPEACDEISFHQALNLAEKHKTVDYHTITLQPSRCLHRNLWVLRLHSDLKGVYYGPGSVKSSLISVLEGFGTKKVLIVTGKSLRNKVGRIRLSRMGGYLI